jgi:hypothetical protein
MCLDCERDIVRGKNELNTAYILYNSLKNNKKAVTQSCVTQICVTQTCVIKKIVCIFAAYSNLLDENSPLFIEKTERLTAYQMHFLRAIIADVHQDFGLASIREEYSLGSSSNIVRIKDALVEKEFIDITPNGIFIADPILETWLRERGKL